MNKTNQAFSEVYDILNHLEEELYNKIPTKFITFLEDNMDKEYIPNISYSKDISEQILLRETKVILSIVYRKYICSDEMKEKLKQEDYQIYKYEQELSNRNYKITFPKSNEKTAKDQKKAINTNVPELQLKWYEKILRKIRNILKRQ